MPYLIGSFRYFRNSRGSFLAMVKPKRKLEITKCSTNAFRGMTAFNVYSALYSKMKYRDI